MDNGEEKYYKPKAHGNSYTGTGNKKVIERVKENGFKIFAAGVLAAIVGMIGYVSTHEKIPYRYADEQYGVLVEDNDGKIAVLGTTVTPFEEGAGAKWETVALNEKGEKNDPPIDKSYQRRLNFGWKVKGTMPIAHNTKYILSKEVHSEDGTILPAGTEIYGSEGICLNNDSLYIEATAFINGKEKSVKVSPAAAKKEGVQFNSGGKYSNGTLVIFPGGANLLNENGDWINTIIPGTMGKIFANGEMVALDENGNIIGEVTRSNFELVELAQTPEGNIICLNDAKCDGKYGEDGEIDTGIRMLASCIDGYEWNEKDLGDSTGAIGGEEFFLLKPDTIAKIASDFKARKPNQGEKTSYTWTTPDGREITVEGYGDPGNGTGYEQGDEQGDDPGNGTGYEQGDGQGDGTGYEQGDDDDLEQ